MNTENTLSKNNMPSLKDEFCVWTPPVRLKGEVEVSEEYLLPDYLPDIRKILLVKTVITNKEVNTTQGKSEIEGKLCLNVVYVGSNGEMGCIKQTYNFSDSIRAEDIYDDSVICSFVTIKNRNVRAMGPRKLVFKCKVESDLLVRNKVCVSPRLIGGGGIEDEFSLERKISIIEGANHLCFSENDIRVSEDIEYKGKEYISDLISYELTPYVSECKVVDGKVNIKGTAKIWCLISCGKDDSLYYDVFEKNIPINHISEVSLPSGDWCCRAVIELGEAECALANDSYGECRIIQVDFDCRADVNAISNENIIFTDDVFSTKHQYTTDRKGVSTERLSKLFYANFSSGGSSELPDSESYKRVFASTSDVDMALDSIKGNRAVFTGECNMKLAAEGDDNGYTTVEFSFPLRYETAVSDIGEHTCVCECRVIDSRITLDGNKVNANVEIGINAMLYENISAETVDTVTIDKNSPIVNQNENLIILYYPEQDDTLWSVAKKYNISRADLEKANNRKLSDGLPAVILIPTNK